MATEYIVIGFLGIIFWMIYTAKSLDDEHTALKAILTMLSFWLVYLFTAVLRQLVENDEKCIVCGITSSVVNLMDFLFNAVGMLCYIVTAYTIIYLLYASYRNFINNKNAKME